MLLYLLLVTIMTQHSWLMLALLAGSCWLVYLLAPVITPFAISAVLAYFGDPRYIGWGGGLPVDVDGRYRYVW